MPRLQNHCLMKENEKKLIFSKMILRVMWKLVPFLPLFEASLTQFSTQKMFWPSNSISLAFKTSLSSHSFATKQLRVSQGTPITLKNNLKVKTWFQTFQNTSSFWELLEPSKKAFFLKCQQATSNPNLEWSKLPMTKSCICFEL